MHVVTKRNPLPVVAQLPNSAYKPAMTDMTALAIIHKAKIIAGVAQGKRLADIAAELGLAGKGQAISNALADDPDYRAARESGLAERLDIREVEMEGAAPVDVPRARELLSHARWRAEREAPKRWGAKTEIRADLTLSVTVNRIMLEPVIIEGVLSQDNNIAPQQMLDSAHNGQDSTLE